MYTDYMKYTILTAVLLFTSTVQAHLTDFDFDARYTSTKLALVCAGFYLTIDGGDTELTRRGHLAYGIAKEFAHEDTDVKLELSGYATYLNNLSEDKKKSEFRDLYTLCPILLESQGKI